jgi:hypothetical protein
MTADPGPGKHGICGKHGEIDCHHPPRAADPLEKIGSGREHELEGISERHCPNHRSAWPLQVCGNADKLQQRLRKQNQHRHAGDAKREPERNSGAQYLAGFLQTARAIGPRGEDEHARKGRKSHHDRDKGERACRRQRAELKGARPAHNRHVDQVHAGPVEAGQHDRPGEAKDAAALFGYL